MSSIVLVGGQKGGSGKTTIATNLAAMLAAEGKDVCLIDADRQESANAWAALRADTDLPSLVCVQKRGKALPHDVRDLAGRFSYLILDAGGHDSVELRGAMTVAHRMLIPLQASAFDAMTLATMDELLAQVIAINPSLSGSIVINRVSPNPMVHEVKDMQQLVQDDYENIDLMHTVLYDRIAYRKAASEGAGVHELRTPDHKAKNEIALLYGEIYDG